MVLLWALFFALLAAPELVWQAFWYKFYLSVMAMKRPASAMRWPAAAPAATRRPAVGRAPPKPDPEGVLHASDSEQCHGSNEGDMFLVIFFLVLCDPWFWWVWSI